MSEIVNNRLYQFENKRYNGIWERRHNILNLSYKEIGKRFYREKDSTGNTLIILRSRNFQYSAYNNLIGWYVANDYEFFGHQ